MVDISRDWNDCQDPHLVHQVLDHLKPYCHVA